MMRPACFDIFDLSPGAGLEELKSAYRDLVNVWHPDRWTHNPRLQKKAERKLQELNAAYAEACRIIQAGQAGQSVTGGADVNAADDTPKGPGASAAGRHPAVRPQVPPDPKPEGAKLWKTTEARLQAMHLNKTWQENHRGNPKNGDRQSTCSDGSAPIRRRRIGEVIPARQASRVVTASAPTETTPRTPWTEAEARLQALASAREQARLQALAAAREQEQRQAAARDLTQARAMLSRLTRRRPGRWRTVVHIAIGLGLAATAGWLIFEYRSALLGWIAGFPS